MAYVVIGGKLVKNTKQDRRFGITPLKVVEKNNQTKKENALKGKFQGNCNRTACQRPGAVYYNFSTRLYYCQACSYDLNSANRTDAISMYAHELCVRCDQPYSEETEAALKEKAKAQLIKNLKFLNVLPMLKREYPAFVARRDPENSWEAQEIINLGEVIRTLELEIKPDSGVTMIDYIANAEYGGPV